MNAKKEHHNGSLLKRLGVACVLSAPLTFAAYGQDRESVEVTDYGTVTLAVQDTDLAQVLEMLSIQSQKNIITSKNVSATISANLYDVTFYEALDAILKVNGYDYIEEGNFIYIYTQSEMSEMEAARRTTESRIFTLNNLSAADANELITPLLSDVGKSSARGDVEPGIKPDPGNVGQDDWAFTAMLVVNDYPENLDAIAQLLEDLDVPPHQVLIEATILQTTLNENNAWGLDFSVLGNINFDDLTSPLGGVDDLLGGEDGVQPEDNNAQVGTVTTGNTAGPGTLKIGILKDEIAVFLRLLDEVTDSVVLARPKIMCLNRQRAEVLVGRRVGYLSTTATETSTTQTVEFLDTGINLIFRPFISKNDMIRLELSPSVSEAFLRDQTNAEGTTVTIPDELTNEITTNVRIMGGNTLVLGGLFRESTSITRRQVPVLGDIPILGAAFRGQDDDVDREEIMFLITPSVLHDEALWELGNEAEDYAAAADVGARNGLLPFSRTKQTDQHNTRAVQAFNRGDTEQALYHVNNSLRLHPQQPEIIRFRERIMGVKEEPHERSILERVFAPELESFMHDAGAFAVPAPVVNERAKATVAARQQWEAKALADKQAARNKKSTANVETATEVDASDTGWIEDATDQAAVAEPVAEPVAVEAWTPESVEAIGAADLEFLEAMEAESVDAERFERLEVVEAVETGPQSAATPRRRTPADRSTGFLPPVPVENEQGAESAVTTIPPFRPVNDGVRARSEGFAPPVAVRPANLVGANDEEMVDQFLHSYFVNLGLSDITQNRRPADDEAAADEDDFPFATFDELLDDDADEDDD